MPLTHVRRVGRGHRARGLFRRTAPRQAEPHRSRTEEYSLLLGGALLVKAALETYRFRGGECGQAGWWSRGVEAATQLVEVTSPPPV